MKKIHLPLLAIFLLAATFLTAQVTNNLQQPTSINTDGSVPDASAILDVQSTTQGMLVPRLTTAQRTAVATPATGLLVFDTDENGFYVFANGQWSAIGLPTGGEWKDFLQIDAAGNAVWRPIIDTALLPEIDPMLHGTLGFAADPTDVKVHGNYAYVFFHLTGDLQIIDVSNPASPVIVGTLDLIGSSIPSNIVVRDNYVYLTATGDGGLIIVDVSNPAAPSIAGNYILVGIPANLDVQGDFAYIADAFFDEIRIYDVSNPASPTPRGTRSIGPVASGIKVAGNFAFITDEVDNQLWVINVANPDNPLLSSQLLLNDAPSAIVIQGGHAYVAGNGNMKIVNITDPFNTFITGTVATGIQNSGVAVQNDFAYITGAIDDDLKTIDVSDLVSPQVVSTTPLGASPIAIDVLGNYAYVVDNSADDLKIVQITEPQIIGVDGAGNLTTVPLPLQATLADADADTKIQVEESPNEDIIRMDLGGSERFILRKNIPNSRTVFDLPNNDGNVLIGQSAGDSTTTGVHNIFIGPDAGRFNKTGNGNIYLGKGAGQIGQSPFSNIFIGYEAGMNSTSGDNTFIGSYAGKSSTTGGENTFLGSFTGTNNTTGSQNTFLGRYAGQLHETGGNNTFVGRGAGSGNISGAGNVFLGRNAGSQETGSNKLYIANSNTATPLIYGEFDNNLVGINGKLGVGTQAPDAMLEVENGAVLFEGTTGATPVSGVGTRLMWIPAKAAFRAGKATGSEWDNANIGTESAVIGGTGNRASGISSFVGGGGNNVASVNWTFIGGGTGNAASGLTSFVGGGSFNTASNTGSFIGGGVYNIASGFDAFIGGGQYGTASGTFAFVGGDSNIASGYSSAAVGGGGNIASGVSAAVFGGSSNDAVGIVSFVGGGAKNVASGNYSFIGGGDSLFAKSYAETVFGSYNTDYTPASAFSFNATDRLFVIGNGTSDAARSDAVTVLKNGNVGIGAASPLGKLSLTNNNVNTVDLLFRTDDGNPNNTNWSTARIQAGWETGEDAWSDAFLKFENPTASNTYQTTMTLKGGKVGIGNPDPTHPLHMGSGAHCTAAGIWTNASDRRLKTDIAPIGYGLSEVLALHPVSYRMRSGGEEQIGFIAQEVRDILPELVSGTEGDVEKGETLGMSYGNLTAVLVKAVQEQQAEIEQLKSQLFEMDELKQRMARLEAALLDNAQSGAATED
ncbi:MAG: tail fiber domain-containing protein [Saprospiraceae bacterium]|nr:tail fiber domain-containing protein [Saprospiraceae bacterium]